MDRIQADNILYSPRVVQQQRRGVFLLIDPQAPNWISTNEPGARILRQCDGRHTLAEIVDGLNREAGLRREDIETFVSEGARAGFVSTFPDLSPPYQGRAQAIACQRLQEFWVHTNNSCPLRCKHCLVDGGTEASQPLTKVKIERAVDEAVGLGAGRVYFTGGDPFLRKDLFELIDYVTSRAQLVILTSGVLLTEEKVSKLKGFGDSLLIQVSLEGPNAEINDSIRGQGNFVKAVDGIRRLVRSGLVPIVTTTITGLNHTHLIETSRFLASIGVRDHHVLWLHSRGRTRQSMADLVVPGARVAEIMEGLRRTASELGIVVDNVESLKARVQSKRGRKNDLCNSCYGVMAVNYDGQVYPCASLVGAPEFDCGSIKASSLESIWRESRVANWVRENSVQKRVGCSSCHLKFFCGGGCFAQSYFDYEVKQGAGCIMAPDPYCDAYKTQLTELMWELATPVAGEADGSRPILYRAMGNDLSSCTADGNKVIDAAFEVGTYHCACVLAMDVKEGK